MCVWMCGEVSGDDTALRTPLTEMENYFFFNPLFIIGMLILFVILVIIVSWYLQKLKSTKEDSEKKLKEGDLLGKNSEVLEGLLTSISEEDGGGRRGQANFGPTTEKVFCSDQPVTEVGLEEECVPGKIMTIIPDKDFRNFPKTEEEQMKMRRHNMLQMLSLPPLT